MAGCRRGPPCGPDLFAQMQSEGYVRFRIDGKVIEAADLPELKKNEKHDVDVVVDRLKVRPDMTQRLAESFEAAMRLAGHCARDGHGHRARVLVQVRLPGVQLFAVGAGAPPVLVQLASGRLPHLRWTGSRHCV